MASAPVRFQKVMDQVLQGLPGIACYINVILVSGHTEEHMTVVDLGFYKGGLLHSCAQSAHEKCRCHDHFLERPRPFSIMFETETSNYQPYDLFSNEFSAKAR
jgi:hypothetical protein